MTPVVRRGRRGHTFALSSVLAVAALLLVAAPSSAAVTIGDSLATAGHPLECGPGPCTIMITGVGGGGVVTAPSDGVIVRWRLRDSAGSSFFLRVVRPRPAGQYTFVSSSATGTGINPGIATFATQQPVKAGDYIAVSWDGTTGLGAISSGAPGSAFSAFASEPPDGAVLSPSDTGTTEALLNADIEADADHDGFGDETQDRCPGAAGPNAGCPPPPTSGPASFVFGAHAATINLASGRGTLPIQCTNIAVDECVFKLTVKVTTTVSASASRKKKRRTFTIGTASGTVAGGKTGSLTVKLSRKGRKLLAKHSPLRVRLVGTSTNRAGQVTPISQKLSLKAKQRKTKRHH